MIFERTTELSPEIAFYLKRTIERDKICPETLPSLIEAIESEAAILFAIKQDNKTYGAIVLTITEDKRYLNVVTLGGRNIKKWKDALWDFVNDLAFRTNTKLLFISRRGWERIFPELKIIGSVYLGG